ncbi:MAG: hypothetical protein KGJ07_06535, partial [Patescibacteria group bacterium]|nr:hypothetical protein [Patescibacteria group bacterium]
QEGQGSLFDDDPPVQQSSASAFADVDDFSAEEKLAFEKELLGIYLTAHPQAQYFDVIKAVTSHELDALAEGQDGTVVTVGGLIEFVKKIYTKKTGAEMAFVGIGNEKGVSIECVIFPKVFDLYKEMLIKDNVVVIEGKLDMKNDKPVVIVHSIKNPKKIS